MTDLAHVWGSDLQIGWDGDLATVTDTSSADSETQQSVLHRLLTAVGADIWDLSYGCGLPELVGQPTNGPVIGAIVRQQLALEMSVAVSPEPIVTVLVAANSVVTLTIQYADAVTGATTVLSFPVGS
jgi:hypothetical protein